MADDIAITVTLTSDQLQELEDRIAGRVLESVKATAPERLLTVDELAEMLGTTPEWVRRHQAQLGAYRLSDGGGRNPIRFRLSEVERFLAKRRPRAPARANGSPSDTCFEAQQRLKAIGHEDADEVWELRLPSAKWRAWGFVDDGIFYLLWWDPNHTVCTKMPRG
jgi:hypothetical protein